MIFRYTVEGKFSATFTASKKVNDEQSVNKFLFHLLLQNFHEGYKKYSGFILYDDNNKIIKRLVT